MHKYRIFYLYRRTGLLRRHRFVPQSRIAYSSFLPSTEFLFCPSDQLSKTFGRRFFWLPQPLRCRCIPMNRPTPHSIESATLKSHLLLRDESKRRGRGLHSAPNEDPLAAYMMQSVANLASYAQKFKRHVTHWSIRPHAGAACRRFTEEL